MCKPTKNTLIALETNKQTNKQTNMKISQGLISMTVARSIFANHKISEMFFLLHGMLL